MEAKAKQKWEPGARVNVGGREYVVMGREETAPKGLAKAWLLSSAIDQSRQYRWRPFRGLELIGGELVRPRRRRKETNTRQRPAATRTGGRAKMKAKGGLFSRLAARFGLRVKPKANVTIRRAPGADISGGPLP
jgi:hypothetical protein